MSNKVFATIGGVMNALFGIGGETSSAVAIKANAGAAEFRTPDDSAFAVARALRLASDAEFNDLATLIDLLGRIPSIEFSFDGDTPPDAGDNEAKFGICHTTGGSFTQGDVVFDDGTTDLEDYKIPHAMHITIASAVSGAISFIANGFYAFESGSWVLKGDGAGAGTGTMKMIELTVPYNASGGNVDSTTSLPSGARVLGVDAKVTTAFNGTSPTLIVKANGSTPLTIMPTTGNNLKIVNQYKSLAEFDIDSDSTGVIRATVVPDSSSAGSAKVYVYYVTAPNA